MEKPEESHEKYTALVQSFKVGPNTLQKIDKIAQRNRRKRCDLIRIVLEDLPEDYTCGVKEKRG